MAKTAKEVTSDIKIIIDGNNTNELSEFNGKKYYASIKDKEGKYLVTGSEPNIKSNKSWCQARIDRGAAVVSDDGKNDKGALIKIKCDKNIGTSTREAQVNVTYSSTQSSMCIKITQTATQTGQPNNLAILTLPSALPITIYEEYRTEIQQYEGNVPEEYYVTNNYSAPQNAQIDTGIGNVGLQGNLQIVDRDHLDIELLGTGEYQGDVTTPIDPVEPNNKKYYKMFGVFVDVTGITLNTPVDFDIYISIGGLTNYFPLSIYNSNYNNNTYGSPQNMVYGREAAYRQYYYAENITTGVYIPAGSTTAQQIPLDDANYYFQAEIPNDEQMEFYFPDHQLNQPHERTYKSSYIPCGFETNVVDSDVKAQNIHNYCTDESRPGGVGNWQETKGYFEGSPYSVYGIKDVDVGNYNIVDKITISEPFVEIID